MSGYKISTGQDLDAIFETRSAVDPSVQYIGYVTADGKSLSERYFPYTSGTKASATGFRVIDESGNAQDLNNYYSRMPVWSSLRGGLGSNQRVLAIHALDASTVYVGGDFSSAGGVPAANIARWNPIDASWSALGAGVSGGIVNAIYALDANNVYVGGAFTTAGGVTGRNRIARWDGANWNALSTGLENVARAIYALDASRVYVGGDFIAAGGVAVNRIARWNAIDSSWSVLGPGVNGSVNAIHAFNASNVYVGGGFTSAGGVTARNRIARWSAVDSSWSSVGPGVGSAVNTIYAVDASNVYVGGAFTNAGGNVNIKIIGRWSAIDSSWSALGTGLGVVGSAYVQSIYAANASNVFVGGIFTTAGGVSVANIAKWNASNASWSALGAGVGGVASPAVNAIYAFGRSNMYAGGLFTTAGGTTVNYIANWS